MESEEEKQQNLPVGEVITDPNDIAAQFTSFDFTAVFEQS